MHAARTKATCIQAGRMADSGSMPAIKWSCAFCNEGTTDDPRELELAIARSSSDHGGQFFRAHFDCLRGALHPEASGCLVDPMD